MEKLAQTNPCAFLEHCLQRCRREVRGYHATWHKQDRIDGVLKPKAVIDLYFREEPFSLFLRWLEGAGKAESALYVEGENNNQLLARPNDAFLREIVGEVLALDPNGPEVTQAARLPITDFGFRRSIERVLADCEILRKQGKLDLSYLGEAPEPEAGNRPCYRFQYTLPEEKAAVRKPTIYVDKDTWLPVGRVGMGKDGEPVAISFYRDIRLNPEFAPEQFQRSSLAPKS
jgi:hypothetical protein